MTLPLAAFPIISTHDAEEAQSSLSRELSNLRFQSVQDRRDFRLDMNGVHLGKTLVAYNHFGTETDVDAGVIENAIIWSICAGEPSLITLDGAIITPDEGCAISPHKRLRIHRSGGSGVFFVRVGYDQIENAVREMVDYAPRQRIVFEPHVDLQRGVGALLRQLVMHFVQDADQEAAILHNPLVRSSFDELLLNSILSLPHNWHDLINGRYQTDAAPVVVRQAEAFLEARAGDPVTISDVVAECECSRRALFNAFRQHRGYTPMQFLSDCRLQLARDALLTAPPGDSVTSIALACGFSHLGRFSAAYKKRYGESPSETLRKQS